MKRALGLSALIVLPVAGAALFAGALRARRRPFEAKGNITVAGDPDAVRRAFRELRVPELPPVDGRWAAVRRRLQRYAPLRAMERAVVTRDEPARIEWQAPLDGMAIEGRAGFRVAPGGRGTEVEVVVRYLRRGRQAAALGPIGRAATLALLQELRRFKEQFETGEVATAAQRNGHSQVKS